MQNFGCSSSSNCSSNCSSVFSGGPDGFWPFVKMRERERVYKYVEFVFCFCFGHQSVLFFESSAVAAGKADPAIQWPCNGKLSRHP